MTHELTRRQQDILEFIIESVRDNGFPPTIAEIGERFSIASTNGVNDHLVSLERKGYIERSSSKARSLRVTDKGVAHLFTPNVRMAPLLGRVAAGSPTLALENVESYLPVETGQPGNTLYCLRVAGDSMIEDGILEGDIVVVDHDRAPRPGDVVVALVDGEATVKHFHPDGGVVELRPANAAMRPMRFPAGEVQVQGVVVALQRRMA